MKTIACLSLVLGFALSASFAHADAGAEVSSRRPLAQCYDPSASNRPGASTILKLKLDILQTRTGSPILSGIGIDMIPSATSPAGFPAIFTTGGLFSRTGGDGNRTSYIFDRPGSYRYLDIASQAIIVQSVTLDRRAGTVSVDIAPGLAGHLLIARGCRFF